MTTPRGATRRDPLPAPARGLAAIASVLLLAGCGSGGDTPGAEAPNPNPELAGDVREELRTLLVDRQALTRSEADCAMRRLEVELAGDEVELTPARELPPEITHAAFEAGIACAGR